MKIKKTRRLHFDELIKWLWEQGIKEKRFYSNKGSYVDFKDYEIIKTFKVDKTDLFTVNEEQEITLDTKIPYFLEKDMYYNYREHRDKSINELLFLNSTVQIWIINEDMTHTLIWKYGELSKE